MTKEITECDVKKQTVTSYFKARSDLCFQACPGDFSLGGEVEKTGEGAGGGQRA